MSAFFNDPLVGKWLADLVAVPCFASLHFEVPSADDPGASEVTGGTYARSPLTWDLVADSARAAWNVQGLSWLNLDKTTIVAVGVWDAPAQGRALLWMTLEEPVVVPDRGSYAVAANEMYVSFN